MEAVVTEAASRELFNRRRLYRPAEYRRSAKADVIEENYDDVRRAFGRCRGAGPVRDGVVTVGIDLAVEDRGWLWQAVIRRVGTEAPGEHANGREDATRHPE